MFCEVKSLFFSVGFGGSEASDVTAGVLISLSLLLLPSSPQRPEIHRGCRKCVSEAAGVQSAQREDRQ